MNTPAIRVFYHVQSSSGQHNEAQVNANEEFGVDIDLAYRKDYSEPDENDDKEEDDDDDEEVVIEIDDRDDEVVHDQIVFVSDD